MRLKDVVSDLVTASSEWSGFLVNQRWIQKDVEVTWSNRYSNMLPHAVRWSDAAQLIDDGQYSFQVVDGSAVQLWYQFESRSGPLSSASLSYYRLSDQTAADAIDDESVGLPWIRFDYDPPRSRGVLHHSCHLHLSLCDGTRIPVHGVPSPRQFLEAVVQWFYPEEYGVRHIAADGSFTDSGRPSACAARCLRLAPPAQPGSMFLSVT